MRNLIRSVSLIFCLGSASLYASPSEEAINASLETLGSPESYHEIAPLSGLQDRYHTGYVALYKRYRVTQEEYRGVEQKFKEAGVPLFFSLIPYAESKFHPDAHGYGTAGLWQFTKQSGRNFGLSVTKKNDERLSINRSTDAAIRYIKSLKQEFGSWYLADFAYAAGEGTIRRLIERNGSKKISVLLKDPHFPSGTKAHFAKTLLLDAKIHHSTQEGEE